MKKIPMRKCVVTQERFPKKELVRVVRTPEGQIEIDPSGKRNGHGAYIHIDASTVARARKSKALDRALEVAVPPEIYDRLDELADEN